MKWLPFDKNFGNLELQNKKLKPNYIPDPTRCIKLMKENKKKITLVSQ